MISSDNELKKYILSDDEWIKIQEIIGLMKVLYLSI